MMMVIMVIIIKRKNAILKYFRILEVIIVYVLFPAGREFCIEI